MATNGHINKPHDENTPLLGEPEVDGDKKLGKGIIYRLLLCGFLVSLSFGVTQVP
jgi:hypothetical protein